MYKELVRRNVLILAISLVFIFVLSLAVVTYVNNNNSKKQILYFADFISTQLVAQTYSDEDLEKFVNNMTRNQQWLAISIAEGEVIRVDSTSSLDEITSRLSADEVSRANSPDSSDKVYRSNGKMCYITTVSDNTSYELILRLSLETTDITEYVLVSILSLAVVLIIMVLLSIQIIGNTSKNVVQAFDRITAHLKTISQGGYTDIETTHPYEEVASAYREINAVNESIVDYISEIKDQRDKINYIINNVEEGLVIVGISGKVYAINDYAKSVLGVKTTDENLHFDKIIGNRNYVDLLAEAISTRTPCDADVYDDITGKIYHAVLNIFVHGEVGEDLVSMMLFDVTEIRNEERNKADFIANASHELKTPITAISGFSELLLSGMVKEESARNAYLDNIHEASISMRHTIDDLLYLSRLDYSDKITNGVQVDLLTLAEKEAEKYRFIADNKNVQIAVEGDRVNVLGDVSLLTHLVDNLVDNAIKYNKPNGKVTISVNNSKSGAVLAVTDTGYGIESKSLDKLFERFYRVDSSRNRSTGGTGLGLTIAHKICLIHNATISVSSVVGQGTTFTITFAENKK